MDKRITQLLQISLALVVSGLLLNHFQHVQAYDQFITHPALTEQMVRFFNSKTETSEYAITEQQAKWMQQGAVEEDEPARWINHFFDPVHYMGWSGKHYGHLTEAEGYSRGGDMAPKHSLPSIEWATNQEYQAAYGRQYGNQTWGRALKAYVDGDQQTAFVALGHVLHLIEDASVPDHTRGDSHPGIEGDPGSPYEESSKAFVQSHNLTIADNLVKNGSQLVDLPNLQDAFWTMAKYSNSNFFSEDTINDEEFGSPIISDLTALTKVVGGKEKGYLYDKNNDIYLATVIKKNNYTLNDDYYVMPSYRAHLMPKDVQIGASVIQLFFKEVEKYKQHPEQLPAIVPDKKVSFLDALWQLPKRTLIKVCEQNGNGVCQKVENNAEGVLVAIKNIFSGLRISVTGNNKINLGANSPKVNAVTPDLGNVTTPQVLGEKITAEPVTPSRATNQTPKPSPPAGDQVQGDKTIQPTPVPPVPVAILSPQPSPVGRGEPTLPNTYYGSGGGGPVLDLSPVKNLPEVVANTTTDATTSEKVVTSTPDTTPPNVPIVTVKNVNGPSSTEMKISAMSSDSESRNIYFDLEHMTANPLQLPLGKGEGPTTTSWVRIVSSTTSTEISVNGIRGNYYYFRARATDEAGNVSNWSATSSVFVNWTSEVVISEVAWAGTSSQFPTDEWFELYNTTDNPVDVKQWQIKVSGTPVNFSKISTTTIQPHSYALFERGRDGVVNDIPADVVYTLAGGFNNNGEKIELFKPNGDKADEVDCSKGWFAGDNSKYRTMERIDPLSNGDDPANWHSNKGFRMTGRTFNGGSVYGSPRLPNKGFIALNGTQEDAVRIITADDNPYVLGTYDIPPGYTLQIDPGVVIKSYYAPAVFNVYGSMSAAGTADSPITFTSGRDQSFSDTNIHTIVGAWSTTTPAAKDWQGFWLRPGASVNFAHTNLRYGGKEFRVNNYIYTGNVSQFIRAESASVILNDTRIEDSGGVALRLESSSTTITRSTFARGTKAVEGISSTVNVDASDFGFFTDPFGPFDIKDVWPELNGLTLHDNEVNVPHLTSVVVNEPGSMRSGAVYISGSISVPASSSLSVDAGATLYMGAQSMIDVKGSVTMKGEQNNPIQIVPFASGTYWANLWFTGSTSSLENVVMLGGNGASPRFAGNDGTMIIQNSNVLCDGCVLLDSKNSGNTIQSSDSTLTLKNSVVGFSARPPFETTGVKIIGGSINLNNTLFSNLTTGVYSFSNPPPPATFVNMSSSSFNNVDYFTQPIPWWGSTVGTSTHP